MINNQVMKAWKQLRPSTVQAKYQQINKKRKDSNNLLSKDEAAYICASADGVDLHKYLTKEEVEKIRNLNGQYSNKNIIKENSFVRKNNLKNMSNTDNKEKIFNFDKECLDIKDSLLPQKFAEEAKKMMILYAKTYIFENSVRNVIRIIMKKKNGDNWWSNIDANIQRKIDNRKKQEKVTPWIGRRGDDELCYSDVNDLKKIMEDNWTEFGLLGDKNNLFSFFDLIEKIRNIIAHHNFVSKDDEDALNVYLRNWAKAVESNKNNLK